MTTPARWKSPTLRFGGMRRSRLFTGIFFSIFLAAGLGFGYAFLFRPVSNIIAARGWQATSCQIVHSEVQSHSSSDGTTYSVAVRYQYSVGGHLYRGNRYRFITGSSSGYSSKAAVVRTLPPGSSTSCFYDSSNPRESVVNRDPTFELLFGLIPLVFVLVGAGGVVTAIRGKLPGFKEPATTPSFAKAIARQTTTLKPAARRGAVAAMMIFVSLFWNGLVGLFLRGGLSSGGAFGLFQTLFLIPFIVVGLVLAVMTIRLTLALWNPQATLTVSTPAVAAGDEVTINWTIDGRIKRLSKFTIALEGREEATYRRGTTTYTDKKVFATIAVAAKTPVDLSPAGFAKVVVPAGAMPSFDAPHNKIIWCLRVRGEVPRWPDSDDEYPLTIAPRSL